MAATLIHFDCGLPKHHDDNMIMMVREVAAHFGHGLYMDISDEDQESVS